LSDYHLLHFGKFNTSGKITRGLPKGAHGVEIKRLISHDPFFVMPEIKAMETLGLASKSPKKVDYRSREMVGARAYYVVRYFNDRGEYSAWSQVKSAIVN
ncbi:MAG: hypothetical protein LBO06_08825, partial [Bacteroidales bacterium]|nr:hypothetical protein [Bacteroidales bacterium]